MACPWLADSVFRSTCPIGGDLAPGNDSGQPLAWNGSSWQPTPTIGATGITDDETISWGEVAVSAMVMVA